MFGFLFRLITSPVRLVIATVKALVAVVKGAVKVVLIPVRAVVAAVRMTINLAADLTYAIWRGAFKVIGGVFATVGLVLNVVWFGVRTVLKIVLLPLRIVGIGRKKPAVVTDGV